MDDYIFVGIDWAWKEHQVVVIDNQGKQLEQFPVAHAGESLAELTERLEQIAEGEIERIKVIVQPPIY